MPSSCAGAGCDGQVLVVYDMLGMDDSFKPRFVRRYATLGATIKDAVQRYVADVRDGYALCAIACSRQPKPCSWKRGWRR